MSLTSKRIQKATEAFERCQCPRIRAFWQNVVQKLQESASG